MSRSVKYGILLYALEFMPDDSSDYGRTVVDAGRVVTIENNGPTEVLIRPLSEPDIHRRSIFSWRDEIRLLSPLEQLAMEDR